MEKQDIIRAVQAVKSSGPKRNFSQAIDLVINLQNLDMKKQESNVDTFIALHYDKGKKVKVCAIVGPELKDAAKLACDGVIVVEDFHKYKDNKKAIKKLSNEYDYFVAQANIMTQIATVFGRVFGPRGKMPNPKAGCVVPPNANLKIVYDRLQKLMRVQTKNAPSIKCSVGSEKMDDAHIVDNIDTVYKGILNVLSNAENSIRNISLKLTMGKPILVEAKKAEVEEHKKK